MSADLAFAIGSGAVAGASVDIALYPLDTLKTRLQAPNGFFNAGGFRGVYRGLSAAALGSAPGAALFFGAYETSKSIIACDNWGGHVLAATIGETAACVVRVPTDNIKQRVQAGVAVNSRSAVKELLAGGNISPLYRGFSATLLREIPFAAIQFPLWESLQKMAKHRKGEDLIPLEVAGCGAVAGSCSAFITTPLDVARTRIMLAGSDAKQLLETLSRIKAEEGVRALMSGALPRTIWMGIGGFVFFGAYRTAQDLLIKV